MKPEDLDHEDILLNFVNFEYLRVIDPENNLIREDLGTFNNLAD